MTKLQELLTEIKKISQENNQSLTDEEPRLTDLAKYCETIHVSLNDIDNSLDQFQKLCGGIEVAPEELNQALRDLNLTESTGKNLRTKLEEIFQLAVDNNTGLANKIKEAELELATILVNVQNQQKAIANYRDRITELETKIISNKNQAEELQIKAGLIGFSIAGGIAGLVIILTKYLPKFKRR